MMKYKWQIDGEKRRNLSHEDVTKKKAYDGKCHHHTFRHHEGFWLGFTLLD